MRDDEGQRRSTGRVKLAAVAVIAIILVCVTGYVIGSRAVPQNNLYSGDRPDVSVGLGEDNGAIPTYAGPAPGDQTANQAASSAPDLPAAPPSPPRDVLEGTVASDEVPAETAADAAPAASDADRQGRQEIGDAIQDATQDALDRGGSVRWHKDGLSGFAIAGAAVSDGGRTCRNAYATTVRDTGETRTPAVRWCRLGDDGPWAAQ